MEAIMEAEAKAVDAAQAIWADRRASRIADSEPAQAVDITMPSRQGNIMNMHSFSFSRPSAAALLVLSLFCAYSHAAKPEGEGGSGNGNGNNKKNKHSQVDRAQPRIGGYFAPDQRTVVSNYYVQQRKAGRCPPGLAKKNNGCLPPGQARKWNLGQPLPAAIVLYPLPQAVVLRIGPAPSGYRYARVANDLLLIAIGTRVVVDAIEDLMSL